MLLPGRTRSSTISSAAWITIHQRDRQTPEDSIDRAYAYRSAVKRIIDEQEAQLMLTTGSTHLAVSRGQQTWYHSTCYI